MKDERPPEAYSHPHHREDSSTGLAIVLAVLLAVVLLGAGFFAYRLTVVRKMRQEQLLRDAMRQVERASEEARRAALRQLEQASSEAGQAATKALEGNK